MSKKVKTQIGIAGKFTSKEIEIPDNEPSPWGPEVKTNIVGKSTSRVDGIAKRIEDRRHFLIDVRRMMPDIRHRQRQVFGKRSGAIDPDSLGMSTQVPPPRQAVAARAANHMTFAADNFARMKVRDVRADFHDFPDKLVPDRHRDRNRLLSPRVPFINVHIRATDPRLLDPDQDIVDADRRFRDVFQPQSDRRVTFDESFHETNSLSQKVSCILDRLCGMLESHCFVCKTENPLSWKSAMAGKKGASVDPKPAEPVDPISGQISLRVKQMRQQRTWSLEQLATASGVSR